MMDINTWNRRLSQSQPQRKKQNPKKSSSSGLKKNQPAPAPEEKPGPSTPRSRKKSSSTNPSSDDARPSSGGMSVMDRRRVSTVGTQTEEAPGSCKCGCRHVRVRKLRTKSKNELDLHHIACPICTTHFKVIVKPKVVFEPASAGMGSCSVLDTEPEELLSDDFLSFLTSENDEGGLEISLPVASTTGGASASVIPKDEEEDDGLPVVHAEPEDQTVVRGEPEFGKGLGFYRRPLKKSDLPSTMVSNIEKGMRAFDFGVDDLFVGLKPKNKKRKKSRSKESEEPEPGVVTISD